MNPYRLALAATTALVSCSSLVHAAVIGDANNPIEFVHLTNWGTSNNKSSFQANDVFTFAGFNSNLGVLHSVVLTAKETVTGTVSATNTGSSSASVNASLQNTVKLVLPTNIKKTLTVSSNPIIDTSLAHGATYGPIVVTEASAHAAASATVHFTSNLSSFTAPWTVKAGDLGQVMSASTNGNLQFSAADTGGIVLTAQYTYSAPGTFGNPTPEPATMAVVGTGLVGLGVVRRRRKATQQQPT